MTDDAHELRDAARNLLDLMDRYPVLFEHVLQLSDEDIETLRELADEGDAEYERDDDEQ
jgi:hypothetical protein